MPIIRPDNELLAGFDPSSSLSLPALFGPEWGFDVASFKKQAWAAANYDQWNQVTKTIVGNLGILHGVPQWSVGGFRDFFALGGNVRPSDVLAMALGKAAQIVSTALAQATTAVPILGWIVELGLAIYEGIKLALEYKRSAPRPPGEAIEFSRDGNEQLAGALINTAKEDDWTSLFLPPSTSGRWTMERVAWTPGGNGEGWAFGTPDEGGWGLIPGLAQSVGTLTTADRYTNYQFPDRSPVSLFGAEFDMPPVSTTGTLRPTAQQVAMLLWQAVMKPSRAMFQIDPFKLVSQWADYYEGLGEFAETLKTEKGVKNALSKRLPSDMHGTIVRGNNPKVPYNAARLAMSYLWSTMNKDGEIVFASPQTVANYDTSSPLPSTVPAGLTLDKIVDVNGDSLSYTYADIVKYVCRIHYDRSFAALSTLVCAYVPPDAPMLKASSNHREEYETMRARLLNHRALLDVELDLIPDAEYRAEVSGRQHIARLQPEGIGLKAPGAGKPIRTPPGSAPTVDGGPEPAMPDAPGPGLPPRPGKSPTAGGAWLGPAAGVLAVTAAGVLVLRKLGRR